MPFRIVIYEVVGDDAEGLPAHYRFMARVLTQAAGRNGAGLAHPWEPMVAGFAGNNPDRVRELAEAFIAQEVAKAQKLDAGKRGKGTRVKGTRGGDMLVGAQPIETTQATPPEGGEPRQEPAGALPAADEWSDYREAAAAGGPAPLAPPSPPSPPSPPVVEEEEFV